jgi:gamma-glutamylcyclotransferase (GGCT)/AIG2-like uncharacterized protein YtfP
VAEHLFVYGTLQREQPHHALLSDCRYLGPAQVRGSLYALPEGYPAATPEGAGEVHGELYELPEYAEFLLRELDVYEAVDQGLFVRRKLRIGDRDTWVYWAGPAVRSSLTAQRLLASGRWPAG